MDNSEKTALMIVVLSFLAIITFPLVTKHLEKQELLHRVAKNNTPSTVIIGNSVKATFPCQATFITLPLPQDEYPPYAGCFKQNAEGQGREYFGEHYEVSVTRYIRSVTSPVEEFNYCDEPYYIDEDSGGRVFIHKTQVWNVNNNRFKVCGLSEDNVKSYLVRATAIKGNFAVTVYILNSSQGKTELLWTKLESFIRTLEFII